VAHLKVLAAWGALLFSTSAAPAADLPSRWDELTAGDWPKAMETSRRTCVLPFGILEKHGLHSPIGSDILQAHEIAKRAVAREYAVVFPDYIFGQINEAKHQPGTFALPARVVWDVLEATLDEIGRNGFQKIVIVNRHGGNPQLITYFMQTLLERRRDYAVFFFDNPATDPAVAAKLRGLRRSDPSLNLHGGDDETSRLLYLRPDLMRMDTATGESGADLARLALPEDLYTPIWWYARFPNHYSGEGEKATREYCEANVAHFVDRLANALKAIKADTRTLELQNEFYDRVDALGRGERTK
jgi:creatinine amidohydrolase